MAKTQRSVQLPSPIYEFAEAYELGNGVKFNRQVLTALLRFYFHEFWPDNSMWIAFASQIEKGVMKIEDIPFTIVEYDTKHWNNLVHRKDLRDIEGVSLDDAKRELTRAQQREQEWADRLKKHGTRRDAVIAKLSGDLRFKFVGDTEIQGK